MQQSITIRGLCALVPMVVLLPAALSQQTLTLDQFRTCISPQGYDYGSTCLLEAKLGAPPNDAHNITQPLVIGRSGILVQGTLVSSRSNTTLRRMAPMDAVVIVADGVYNVSIWDFTFDGNRRTYGGVRPKFELNLGAGTSGIYVSSDFVDSQDFAGSVCYSECRYAWSNFHGGCYPVGTPTCQPNTSALYVSNAATFWLNHNLFESYGTGAVGIFQSTAGEITWNTFYGNHWQYSFGNPGGQLVIDAASSNIDIGNNVIDGMNVPPPPSDPSLFIAGVEAYGSGLFFGNNEIRNHNGNGMSLVGVSHVHIAPLTRMTVHDNNTSTFYSCLTDPVLFDGILVANFPGLPYAYDITIDGTSSINGHCHGIKFQTSQIAGSTISGVKVTNTCTAGNHLVGLEFDPGVSFVSGHDPFAPASNNLLQNCQ
jgi:hypothetical protein